MKDSFDKYGKIPDIYGRAFDKEGRFLDNFGIRFRQLRDRCQGTFDNLGIVSTTTGMFSTNLGVMQQPGIVPFTRMFSTTLHVLVMPVFRQSFLFSWTSMHVLFDKYGCFFSTTLQVAFYN